MVSPHASTGCGVRDEPQLAQDPVHAVVGLAVDVNIAGVGEAQIGEVVAVGKNTRRPFFTPR